MLESIMPHIGQLTLDQIHDATLAPYVKQRKVDVGMQYGGTIDY
jgi:hypothetical protein